MMVVVVERVVLLGAGPRLSTGWGHPSGSSATPHRSEARRAPPEQESRSKPSQLFVVVRGLLVVGCWLLDVGVVGCRSWVFFFSGTVQRREKWSSQCPPHKNLKLTIY